MLAPPIGKQGRTRVRIPINGTTRVVFLVFGIFLFQLLVFSSLFNLCVICVCGNGNTGTSSQIECPGSLVGLYYVIIISLNYILYI